MSLKTHYGIFNNSQTMAILTQTGKLHIIGNDEGTGGTLNSTFSDFFLYNDISDNIVKVVHTDNAFTVLRRDGKVFTWGENNRVCYDIEEENNAYIDIFSNDDGFGGLKSNGTFFAWGDTTYYNNWTKKMNDKNNKIIQVVSWANRGFILLRQDGTLALLFKYDQSSITNTILTEYENIGNIKKIGAGSAWFAALTYDGKLYATGTSFNINSKIYGIRGRDLFYGDTSVANSGVKEFYMSRDYVFFLKEDNSFHIIGGGKFYSGTTFYDYGSDKFFSKQYEKLQSGVVDVHITYEQNKCICLKDDGTAIPLYLEANNRINNTLVNIEKLYNDYVIDVSGKVICLYPEIYDVESVEDEISSDIVDLAISSIYNSNHRWTVGLKNDGSIITWGDKRVINSNDTWGDHKNSNTGLKDYTNTIDTTLGDSGVIKLYTMSYHFAILKDDGKIYFWGMTQFTNNKRTNLTNTNIVDISNSVYAENNGFKKNYTSFDVCYDSFYTNDNLYDTLSPSSLNQSNYNSNIFSISGTINGFTTFSPSLENNNIFIYNDKTSKGIIENNNTDIQFTLNNGLSSNSIQSILNHNLSLNSTFTFGESNYNNSFSEDSYDDNNDKKLKRMQMIRTLFQNNYTVETFITNKTSLGLNDDYLKTNFKVMHTLNNTELTYDFTNDNYINTTSGFYVYMDQNSKSNIKITNSNTLTFECNSSDASNNFMYYISSNNGNSGIYINYTNSNTYISESYPAGPFKDGDKIIMKNINFYFNGGIIENGNTADTTAYSKEEFVPYVKPIGNKIPIFCGQSGFIGIAKNNYLYSWGSMSGSTQWVSGSKDANGDWTNSTTDRVNDISNVYIGYQNRYAVLLKNGKIDERYYGFPSLDDAKNVWYDNGVKKNDLTELNDAVELFCLFNDHAHGAAANAKALVLRQDGSIALWANRDDFKTYNSSAELTSTQIEEFTLRSSYAKRLMDSTDPNFSRIIKICRGIGGYILLREDGKIAVIDRRGGDRGVHMGDYPSWNRRNGNDYYHNVKPSLDFTLGNITRSHSTFGSKGLTSQQYLGKVIDIGTFGYTHSTLGIWYVLNEKGQFFVFRDYYGNASNPTAFYPPVDICYGDKTLDNPTDSPYFKKTVKVYSTFNHSVPTWLIIFQDGTGLTSWSETSYSTNQYTHTDVFTNYSWYYDSNNPIVKGIQPTDSILIDQYYGPYVLLKNGFLRNISYTMTQNSNNNNPYYIDRYYNWNHHQYGIKGTGMGYDASEPEYGDISGVKQILFVGHATLCVKTNGELLVWGNNSGNSLKIGDNQITTDITNHFTNVNKVVSNMYSIAILKNDGSVFVWGHSTYGGDITNTVPVGSTGMSNYTLDSGVIDIFANTYAYTAVKIDGLLVWGHSSYANPGNATNGHSLDALENIQWETKSEGFNSRTFNNSYAIGGSIPHQTASNNEYNYLDYPQYKKNTTIDTIISSLISGGINQYVAENLVCFPKNVANFNLIKFPEDFYKGVSKDSIRDLIIQLFFEYCPNIYKFQTIPETISLDGKINKPFVDVIRSNSGITNITGYDNKMLGFYVILNENDTTILENKKENITLKFTRNGSNYIFEKIDGLSDISSNKTSPLTGKVNINNFDFNFKNGIYSSVDEHIQKYNCIITNLGAAAYLTNSGKVITWGQSSYGGFSHHESIFTNYSSTIPHSGYDVNEPEQDIISGVVDIISRQNGFIALKSDGTFVQWGSVNTSHQYQSTHDYYSYPFFINSKNKVKSIYTNYNGAIALLLFDKSLITFGNFSYGGHQQSYNTHILKNIEQVFPSLQGFAAINSNQELFTWGHSYISLIHPDYGIYATPYRNVNNISGWVTKLPNIAEFYSNYYHNVAIDINGHILIWGYSTQGTYPAELKVEFNTRTFVNVLSTQRCHAAIDTNGGVVVWGSTQAYDHWKGISGEVSSGVTRIFANDYGFFCLKDDNTAVGLIGEYYGWDAAIDFSNNEIRTSTSQQMTLPPSKYIADRYKLRNIKDIFSSKYGWTAIDISDNVICWGHKENYYITDIDYNKIHGGDLSGNEEDVNRPIAIFTNGMTWACLKEDETVVTWEGTTSYSNGEDSYKRGSNYNDTTYGINGTYWGGNGQGGAVRGGDGSITTLRHVKNIVPYGNRSSWGGYIAICEDLSGNQSVVQWGSDHDTSRWKQTTPNASGRAFRHVCEELTNHSKNVIGIRNESGAHYGWQISNNENLHEYNFGDKKFTDTPTGFGQPIQTVEIINSDDVIADILKDISNSSIDISTNFIQEASKEENKLSEEIDEDEAIPESVAKEEQTKISKVIKLDNFKSDPIQLRKQRTSMVRLVFANNPNRTKFKVANSILGDTDRFKKSNSIIYRVNFGKAEVNLKEDPNINDSTGFFVPLTDGDELTMTNFRGDTKFKITKSEDKFDDETNKYFVEIIDGVDHSISLYRSGTYINGSRPQGPFHEDDRARIAGVDVEFGSVMEGSPNYSFGDPYINPICGYPTKLPDKNAIYRMVEGFGLYINASVHKLSTFKQNRIKNWFYNKAGYSAESVNLITNGYYYNKFFISSENHNILFDLNKETIFIKSHELEYFDIKNSYEYEKHSISLKEKCNKYTITWHHKILGRIQFFIKIYENPQIDNGISIDIEQNAVKCRGLLINNYKPNLMQIENIKEKKSIKLKKRLRKCKNKFSTRKLVNNNEIWLNIKNN